MAPSGYLTLHIIATFSRLSTTLHGSTTIKSKRLALAVRQLTARRMGFKSAEVLYPYFAFSTDSSLGPHKINMIILFSSPFTTPPGSRARSCGDTCVFDPQVSSKTVPAPSHHKYRNPTLEPRLSFLETSRRTGPDSLLYLSMPSEAERLFTAIHWRCPLRRARNGFAVGIKKGPPMGAPLHSIT